MLKDLKIDGKFKWSRNHFLGYLESWSSVQRFKEKKKADPIDLIKEEIISLWPEEKYLEVNFPITLKVFKI